MAASSSQEPASSSGGAVAASAGSNKTEELGEQIINLKKQQQDLVREKKKLQADLRNAQRRKKRLTKRTRMLSDTDLLAIVRMRAAHASEEDKVADDKSAKPSELGSPGAAAVPGKHLAAGEQPADAASKENAEQLDIAEFSEDPAKQRLKIAHCRFMHTYHQHACSTCTRNISTLGKTSVKNG